MHFDAGLLYGFLLVFIRCGAMLLVSPVFGAQNSPIPVRVFTTLAIAAALTCVLKPAIGPVPSELYSLAGAVIREALAGILIGGFMSLVLQAATVAGSIIDLQMGLSISQELSPLTGVPVTVISQFKYMLALVVFLSVNGHHAMIIAFTRSYQAMPALGYEALPAIKVGLVDLVTQVFFLALQMAAPVLAVSLVVDAGLGIVNKAVPQMQAMLVGLPAKVIMGMLALAIGLPILANSISNGVGFALRDLGVATGAR